MSEPSKLIEISHTKQELLDIIEALKVQRTARKILWDAAHVDRLDRLIQQLERIYKAHP